MKRYLVAQCLDVDHAKTTLSFVNLPSNPSESFKRRNPELYPPVGAVGQQKREPGAQPALVRNVPRQPKRQGRLAVIVTIISCRHRLCDDDNSGMGGNKALRDAIAKSLAADDDSPAIRFQYSQCRTDGWEGTIVKLERL